MLEISFHPFPELVTSRLLLRKLENTDAEQFFRLRSDKEVMRYIGKKPMEKMEEALDFINLLNDNLEKNTGITWGMALREEPGKLIGTIALWRIVKEHFRAEIGYMLLPEYWRKGFTKEAIEKVVEYGFHELKLHSIEGDISAINTASAKTLESAGFVKEAHFKEDFFFDGKFEDTIIYSLLNNKS
jgi:ribosomal-protein-alanine N-acetyltransferase